MLAPVYSKGEKRLLEAADLVENSSSFDMHTWIHPCGTPACVLGHYAVAHPEAWGILNGVPFLNPKLSRCRADKEFFSARNESRLSVLEGAAEYFGISRAEADIIFSGSGCGMARTGAEAAAFIRGFVTACVQRRLQVRTE